MSQHHICPTSDEPLSCSRQYTIRYRCCTANEVVLLVEDEGGHIYLFCGGILQLRFANRSGGVQLDRVVAGTRAWVSVPTVAPYSLAQLRQLV
jgi:hypothetical protein